MLQAWNVLGANACLKRKTSQSSTSFYAQNYLKYYIKLQLDYMYKEHMKRRWISCLDLNLNSKAPHYAYANISKFQKKKYLKFLDHFR